MIKGKLPSYNNAAINERVTSCFPSFGKKNNGLRETPSRKHFTFKDPTDWFSTKDENGRFYQTDISDLSILKNKKMGKNQKLFSKQSTDNIFNLC